MSAQVGVAGVLIAAVVLSQVSTVHTQERDRSQTRSRPPAEIGGAFAVFAGDTSLGVGLRVTIPTSERTALEIELDWRDLNRGTRLPDQLPWVYFVGGRRLIAAQEDEQSSVFLSYGATGWADRSLTPSGLDTSFYPPLLPTAGIAWQRRAGNHAAFRSDFRVIWPLAADDLPGLIGQFTIGISLPIRPYR